MTTFLAMILGIVAGFVSLACNIFIPQIPDENDPNKRFVYSFAGLLISTIFAGVMLVLFYLAFKPTFVWFGVSLCVTYILGLMAYFLQNIKLLKRNSGKQ